MWLHSRYRQLLLTQFEVLPQVRSAIKRPYLVFLDVGHSTKFQDTVRDVGGLFEEFPRQQLYGQIFLYSEDSRIASR